MISRSCQPYLLLVHIICVTATGNGIELALYPSRPLEGKVSEKNYK